MDLTTFDLLATFLHEPLFGVSTIIEERVSNDRVLFMLLDREGRYGFLDLDDEDTEKFMEATTFREAVQVVRSIHDCILWSKRIVPLLDWIDCHIADRDSLAVQRFIHRIRLAKSESIPA